MNQHEEDLRFLIQLKKNELLCLLHNKCIHITKENGILIDDTLYESLKRFNKSTIIHFLNEDNDNKTLTNILTTEYNLDRDSKFLKKLKGDEILNLVLDKSIYLKKN